MKKQTKILAAATLLTLGASFSSMAALKNGTWVQNEDGWQYIDKDGEYVESEWCYSNGVEYWINDEGFLGANEWVNEGEYTFYVDEYGRKSTNKWQYIFGEDEEDADEESWFYFDAKGRMLENEKKAINGSTYYFDENGKMLTGWVDYHKETKKVNNVDKEITIVKSADNKTTVGQVVFCNEDGALVKSAWINEFPWTKNADDLYEGEDEEWYYAKSNGSLATKKQSSINDQTYFFNENSGIMMEGWVINVPTVDDEDNTVNHYVAVPKKTTFTEAGATEVYYATEDGDGHVKKNGWKELEGPDGETYWYHFDKLGRAFLGRATGSNAQPKSFDNGENVAKAVINDGTAFNVEAKKINGVKYYFNENGEMLDGLVEIGGKLMYLDGGAAQTGKVTLTDANENDYTFCFGDKTNETEQYEKFVAVTGNKDGYCYVGGLLVTSDESGVYRRVQTTVGDFIVDYRGKIMHNNSKEYFEENETFEFVTTKGATKYSIVK